MSTKVKVTLAYRDLELGRFVREGEIIEVSDERASLLVSKKFVRILEVKNDEVEIEQKEEKPEVKTKELKTTKKTK